MGLERIACVLQGVLSNFETDLFTPLIKRAEELTGHKVEPDHDVDRVRRRSLRIIADHSRAATFLISDGVLPSNEGRGYVLRKIMRRGIRHGRLLGQEKPFMHEMVYAVRDEMGAAYPELKESADRVAKVVLAEEQQFARTAASLALRADERGDVAYRERRRFIFMRPSACRWTLWSMLRGTPGFAFDMDGFEQRSRRGAGARACIVEGRIAEVGGARCIASWRRRSSRATQR